MVKTLKLTSKRQATFPAALCDELGVRPGDELKLERKVLDGESAWIIQAKEKPEMPWFRALNAYAEAAGHDMESIRASIGRATGEGK